MTEPQASDNMASILRRIQKMLAMANDGRGDPNEAAAAAKAAIVEAFGEFKYGASKATRVRDEGAYVSGMREARKVDLNTRGVGGQSSATVAIK